jgi:glycosyltransferase involved in cell wall biosynthesis
VAGLSLAVLKLLEDSGRARQLGENGRARSIEQFSADSMARRYLQLYSEVASTPEQSKKRNHVEYEYNA